MKKKSWILAILLLTLVSSTRIFAQTSDKKPEVPLTLSMLEKCMYMGIDTVQKIIETTGFVVSGSEQEKQILTDKWKPSRTLLFKKGKVDLVIVFSSAGVYHFTLRSDAMKDKTGEELLLASFKAGYKEITHDGENPRVSRNGKIEAKYNTANKPWTFDLNEKK